MIKDISIIREELNDYAEVQMPYDFPKGCHIKYITLLNDEELFSSGGKFCNICNDYLVLKNKGSSWRVPIYIRQKCGKIIYETKLFIPENTNEIIMNGGGGKRNELINNKELEETINYQQSIIEKLIKRVEDIEIQKKDLYDQIQKYEELLQQNRYSFKELSIQLNEKTKKLNKYEKLIPKINDNH